MTSKRKILFSFIIILLLTCFNSVCFCAKKETQDLKVLVIEINPILESITNKEYYPDNDGHPKVSEFFGQDTNKAIDELKEDLEFCSHGYLNIIMDYEYLNEFPTYTSTIKSTNLHRFTEEMYLENTRSAEDPDRGYWYAVISYLYNKVTPYTFDYEYLIEKFDLINRRNNGEFDQVWINSIDPAHTYETMMVGKDAFWINGTPLKKKCNNFIIANISISRRDANLHALGHGFEGIMSQVFNGTYFQYGKTYDDYTEEDFRNLNLWEQFSMTASESSGGNAGIGNVHFPYNAESDYDYGNKRKVYSYWKNWLNYPDLSGPKTVADSSAWLNWSENNKLGADQNKDSDRLYMRLWFYLFPHIEGVTKDGYYNNWWKYFITLDYAKNVECKYETKKYNGVSYISDKIFKVEYASGKVKEIPFDTKDASINVSDERIIKINGSKLNVLKAGKTYISCFVDGISSMYRVKVTKENGAFNVKLIDALLPDEDDGNPIIGIDDEIEEIDTTIEEIKEETKDEKQDTSKEIEKEDKADHKRDNDNSEFIWKNASDWAIKELKEADNLNLIPDIFNDIDLTNNITRIEFAYVAVKLNEKFAHKIITPSIDNPFIDVDDKEVLKAYCLGITKGTSANEFSPDQFITREEMATMLTRAISQSGVDTTIDLSTVNKFSDDDQMKSWSRESIYYMANKNVILGMDEEENIFGVEFNATREQALLISKRCVKNIEK